MYYNNCSYGNLAEWTTFEQCLVDKEHIIGQIVNSFAIPLWTYAHIYHYVTLRSRARSPNSTRIVSFLFTHWLADCIGAVSAFLAQQWLSQIIFGACALLVHTICCLHYLVVPLQSKKNIVSIDNTLTIKKRSRLKSCPHMLSILFTPTVILTVVGGARLSSSVRAMSQVSSNTPSDFHIPHIVGYTFGALAGVLHCSQTLIDMVDSYITVESSCAMITAYILRILGEGTYVTSVLLQNTSIYDHIRTSPWTMPRLIAAGLNIGILIQRCIQRKKGKRRRLSREDAECLLSSESDTEFYSDDSEEEIIWMPLKSVQSAIPNHPVCISRVQILSEADLPPEAMSPFENEARSDTETDKHVNEQGVEEKLESTDETSIK